MAARSTRSRLSVEAVGSAVTRFQVGDEVFGLGQGAFAEVARAREDLLALKPASLTFVQAAAVGASAKGRRHGLGSRP
jgi:NADPH:quinone reductase-like Zn-dependent oxidoreductase